MVGLGRFELPTSPLSGVRSNQLSYRPKVIAKLAGSLAEINFGGSQKTSFIVKRVSRTRLNMLDGYAVRDHRAMVIKQRRLVSEFPRSPSGTAIAGLMDIHSRRLPIHIGGAPHSRKGYECHRFSFRKEVIQPQVLLRLPCYDFTPIMNYTLDGCPLAVGSPASSATHFRDVTGGVYKARERIHRGILIRDY